MRLEDLGFSKKSSEYLYRKYGDSFWDILRCTPEKLARDIESEQLLKARILYAEEYAKKTFRFFASHDIPERDALSIYEKFGDEAIRISRKNPYILLEANGVSFDTIDHFALSVFGCSPHFIGRVKAGILESLANSSGSLYLSEEEMFVLLEQLLDTEISETVFMHALSELRREKRVFLTSIASQPIVYAYEDAVMEFDTAKFVARKLKHKIDMHGTNVYRIIEQAMATLGILLSNEQIEAVYTALTTPLSVLTGGPGTGKTAVQKVMIKSYKIISGNKDVRLIAPTGQAAKRMTESTGYPATTIHKALGMLMGDSKATKSIVIDEGLIIVDEASMVDSELFYTLVSHVSDDSRLVIVGDTAQLPSIGAGCVLQELISCKEVPCNRLTKVFRQAEDSSIAFNAARINCGETTLLEEAGFAFLECEEDDLPKAVGKLYKSKVDEFGIDNVICLTAFRKSTDTGVNALNVSLRKLIRPEITASTPSITIGDITFYQGDKVVYGRNKDGLVNGDIGYISAIRGRHVDCTFGDRKATLSGTELDALDLAYAQTVHRAQGSEYKVVIMVVDPKHKRMNKRNMIYTAATRAKDLLYIVTVNGREPFNAAVKAMNPKRHSSLSRLIVDYTN